MSLIDTWDDEQPNNNSEQCCHGGSVHYFIDSLNPDYICRECGPCGTREYMPIPKPPIKDAKDLWLQAKMIQG